MMDYRSMPKVGDKPKSTGKSNKMMKIAIAGIGGLVLGYLVPFAIFGWYFRGVWELLLIINT